MPAPVFTPEQEAEIRRMIEQQVSVDALSYKVHAPPPPDAEKGDLAKAIEWLEHHGFPAAAAQLSDAMLPGRDLARAKEAEAKLAKVEASRGKWREAAQSMKLHEKHHNCLGCINLYNHAIASDKEAGL